jgi:hypothetical protein
MGSNKEINGLDDVFYTQMTNGWGVRVHFEFGKPNLSLICPCGSAKPREMDDYPALRCESCKRVVTVGQLQRMLREAAEQIAELSQAFVMGDGD